jgi:hypothetical protein
MPTAQDTVEARAYRLLQRTILLCAGLFALIVTLFMMFALDKSSQRCKDVQAIRTFVLQSTERSLVATPTLDYYKNHPDELEVALENLRAQREVFRESLDCSRI